MGKVLIIGAGGVATVAAHKVAQHPEVFDEIMIATRRGNGIVHPGDKLCGTRVIPLVIEEEKLRQAEQAAGGTRRVAVRPFT